MGTQGVLLTAKAAADALKAMGLVETASTVHDLCFDNPARPGRSVQVHKKGLVSRTAIGAMMRQLKAVLGIDMTTHDFLGIARSPRPDRAFQNWQERQRNP